VELQRSCPDINGDTDSAADAGQRNVLQTVLLMSLIDFTVFVTL